MADATAPPVQTSEGADASLTKAGVPDRFVQCGCCAITCCNFEKCIGCKAWSNICCVRQTALACKPVENEDVCCVCQKNMCEVAGCGLYDYYTQCFCYECICSCCCNLDQVWEKAPSSTTIDRSRAGFPQAKDVKVCNGLCCDLQGWYCSCPEICGCASSSTCCCLEQNSVFCKSMGKDPTNKDNDVCCLCNKSEVVCIPVGKLCGQESQVCCFYDICAIPCDDDVPCTCFLLPGLSLFINWNVNLQCCMTLQHLRELVNPQKYETGAAPAAPAQNIA